MAQAHRRDRQHRKSLLVDDERILVGAVAAAAILHDPQAAGGDLIGDAMVEQDHAVGDVLLETVARQRVFAAFAGDDRRYAERFQELKQPPNLGAQNCRVRETGEQRLDRIEHYPLRADRLDRILQPDEKSFEVVLARLGDFIGIDMHVIDRQHALAGQFVEIEI